MNTGINAINEAVQEAGAFTRPLFNEIGKVIIGQTYLVERLVVGLLANGHVLRSEEHTSELQSHSDLHSFPTRRSSDLRLHASALQRNRQGDHRADLPRRTARRGTARQRPRA